MKGLKLAVSGPDGFLGWHTRCAIQASQGRDAIVVGRPEFSDPELMDSALAASDAVIHLAGVNRAADSEIELINPWLAQQIVDSMERTGRFIPIVNGNSIHSEGDSVFGVSKRKAAEIFAETAERNGSAFVDVVLPNIFGEHGRPNYNSVVATFCHQLANGETPKIDVDRELTLLHAQDAVTIMIASTESPSRSKLTPVGHQISVISLLESLKSIQVEYRNGYLPDLSDPFTRSLFNTYRSFTFPQQWPIHPELHADARGELVEVVRASGGETQVFYSATRPGFIRGEHFHLRKTERFQVVQGQASIRLRKLFTSEVIEFVVSGSKPAIVDMPTLWTHSITNIGDSDLLTLFYSDDKYDPADPDTYWIDV